LAFKKRTEKIFNFVAFPVSFLTEHPILLREFPNNRIDRVEMNEISDNPCSLPYPFLDQDV